jgi:hypothetical protein
LTQGVAGVTPTGRPTDSAPANPGANAAAPALNRPTDPSHAAIIDPKKYDYFFGKVVPDKHNTPRSQQMLGQLARVGVFDNQQGRASL